MTNYSRCDDDFLYARTDDMIKLCEKRHVPIYSSFLNEKQCELIRKRLNNSNCSFEFILWGGCDDAERKILSVFDNFIRPKAEEFPICCLTLSYRKADKLTHRDVLGAVMALKINRDAVGDIIIEEGNAQIFVTNSVKSVIINDIKKIGSIGVNISDSEPVFLIKKQDFKEIKGTIASMRADALIGLALNISRSKAADMIKNIGVEINFILENEPSYFMKIGDVFSVRGYGKFRINNVSGLSKKGRLHIIVDKFC